MKKQEKICRYRQQRNSELNEIRMKKMEEKIINNERIMAVMNKYALMLTSEDNEISRYNIIAQRKAELSALQCDHVKRITELEREYISLQNEIDRVCLEMEDDEPAPPTSEEIPDQQQPTVWLDGSRHTAQITLRRIINKLPDTKGQNVSFDFALNCQGGKWWLVLTEAHGDKVNQAIITDGYGQEQQVNDWLQEIKEDFE